MCLEENQAGSWLAALAPSIPPYIHIHAKELGPFDSMCLARKRRWVETAWWSCTVLQNVFKWFLHDLNMLEDTWMANKRVYVASKRTNHYPDTLDLYVKYT